MGYKIISFKLPAELLDQIDNLAMRKNTTRSEIIRRAIAKYLDNNTTDNPPKGTPPTPSKQNYIYPSYQK